MSGWVLGVVRVGRKRGLSLQGVGEASLERRCLSAPCVSAPLALEESHRDIISFGEQQVPQATPSAASGSQLL